MQVRSRVNRLLFLLLFTAICALAALTRPHMNRLIDRAVPLYAASGRLQSATYFWLSPDSILDVESNRKIDVATGKVSPLPGFKPGYTLALGDGFTDDGRFHNIVFCYLSPNTQWLVCPDVGPGDWKAYSLDGKRSVEWTGMPDWRPPLWTSDHTFYVLPGNGSPGSVAYHCDVNQGGPAARIPLGRKVDSFFVGVLPDKRLMFMPYDGGRVMLDVDYTAVRIDSRNVELRNGKLRLPCHAAIETAEFSPDGRRVAWTLFCDRRPRGPSWYRRLMRWMGRPDVNTWELWTSDFEGKHWNQVGIIGDSGNSDLPYALQWTSDGRRLSFLIRKTLYVVDAD